MPQDQSKVAFDPEEMREFLAQAVGEASGCWDNLIGAGVFDDQRAIAIVDRLMDRFELHQERLI